NGKKYRTKLFDCFHVSGDSNKIAVVVPKRKIKLSTERNFLKRRIREAYRLNKFLLTKNGFYLVFIYKSQEKKSFKEIEICMMEALLNLEGKI
ncbi:MAG: ribonuclease P protein component, partial [Cytophagales bacterium]|nr:ribonuclease P protein component [Cytophagales bacterium]